jgi:hypothetical protein
MSIRTIAGKETIGLDFYAFMKTIDIQVVLLNIFAKEADMRKWFSENQRMIMRRYKHTLHRVGAVKIGIAKGWKWYKSNKLYLSLGLSLTPLRSNGYSGICYQCRALLLLCVACAALTLWGYHSSIAQDAYHDTSADALQRRAIRLHDSVHSCYETSKYLITSSGSSSKIFFTTSLQDKQQIDTTLPIEISVGNIIFVVYLQVSHTSNTSNEYKNDNSTGIGFITHCRIARVMDCTRSRPLGSIKFQKVAHSIQQEASILFEDVFYTKTSLSNMGKVDIPTILHILPAIRITIEPTSANYSSVRCIYQADISILMVREKKYFPIYSNKE